MVKKRKIEIWTRNKKKLSLTVEKKKSLSLAAVKKTTDEIKAGFCIIQRILIP